MKKTLQRIIIALGGLILIAVCAAFVLNSMGKAHLNKVYDVQPRPITIPTDSTSVAAGQKWAAVLCTGCHGENYAGTKFMDVPEIGMICAPNLTPAGICKGYTDADWDRALRHGLGKSGQPLLIMRSEDFQYMSDEHIGHLIAYLKTLPPVEQNWPTRSLTFASNVLFQVGVFGELSADRIDHKAPAPVAPAKAEDAKYGEYLTTLNGCWHCHGEQLNGGKSPDAESPLCPDISAGSSTAKWGPDAFVSAMRTGNTPMGKEMMPKFMPWREFGRMDDVQLKAIYAYLMTIPAASEGAIK